MRKLVPWFLATVLMVAACGDADSTSSDGTASSSSPSPSSSASVDAPGAVAVDEGPVAPDFELALADGGTFAPSAEEKPIYLVFWAEW